MEVAPSHNHRKIWNARNLAFKEERIRELAILAIFTTMLQKILVNCKNTCSLIFGELVLQTKHIVTTPIALVKNGLSLDRVIEFTSGLISWTLECNFLLIEDPTGMSPILVKILATSRNFLDQRFFGVPINTNWMVRVHNFQLKYRWNQNRIYTLGSYFKDIFLTRAIIWLTHMLWITQGRLWMKHESATLFHSIKLLTYP